MFEPAHQRLPHVVTAKIMDRPGDAIRANGVIEMLFWFRQCGKCGGDLMSDSDEWTCFQCGRTYYPQLSSAELLSKPNSEDQPASNALLPSDGQRRRRRKPRRINAVIAAKERSDERWHGKNEEVIFHLEQGKCVRDISKILGRSARQIRGVRERLTEQRAAETEQVA